MPSASHRDMVDEGAMAPTIFESEYFYTQFMRKISLQYKIYIHTSKGILISNK